MVESWSPRVFFEKKGRQAFPGAQNHFEATDDISSDLAAAVETLSQRDQEAFRAAAVRVLRESRFNDDSDLTVAEAVLRLGVRIKAVGMLETLSEKSFALEPSAPAKQLFQIAFESARDLAGLSSAYAERCLMHLIERKDLFDSRFAGQALVALAEANPHNFPQHFRLLSPHLNSNFGFSTDANKDKQIENRRRALARSLLRRVPDNNRLVVYAPNLRVGPES